MKLRIERQNFLADEFEGFSQGVTVMNQLHWNLVDNYLKELDDLREKWDSEWDKQLEGYFFNPSELDSKMNEDLT